MELHALRWANPRGTLSAFLRRTGCARSTARHTILIALLGWLTAHLLTDGG